MGLFMLEILDIVSRYGRHNRALAHIFTAPYAAGAVAQHVDLILLEGAERLRVGEADDTLVIAALLAVLDTLAPVFFTATYLANCQLVETLGYDGAQRLD